MAVNDLLSQEEIDALLHGVTGPDFEAEEDGEGRTEQSGVRDYDFASEDRSFHGRTPALESINQRFCRHLRASLLDMFGPAAGVSEGGVEMMDFGEYVHTLFIPTSLNAVTATPLRGSALVVFDPALVSCAVETWFGGNGRKPARIEGRDFSPTERHVSGLLLDSALNGLRRAWAPVLDSDFRLADSGSSPDHADILEPNEIVVTSKFQIEVAGGVGEMHVTFPYTMLEPVRERLDAGPAGEREEADEHWGAALRGRIRGAEVELSATLAEKEVPLRDVLTMKAGDLIPIPAPTETLLFAEGVPLFNGRLVEVSEHFAVEISERLEQPGQDGNAR